MNEISEAKTKRSQVGSGSLAFRLCTDEKELPYLIELAREAHLESRFGHIPFSAQKVEKIARKAMLDTKRHGVMICFRNEEPVGFAYCSVGEYHIGSNALIATVHNMNVSSVVRSQLSGGKVALGLFRGVHTWAKARNACEVLFHVTSGVEYERTHKTLSRIGYTFIGGSYAKSFV
jgi:hypothetical protein